MSDNSKIEWTDHTFNPWWGCQKVGPGCDHCYAEAFDKRTGGAHWGPNADRRRTKDWGGPRRWQKNAAKFMAEHGRCQRVFCASMADVFDNVVPQEWRADLWQVIRETPDLDWLIVTKRIGNAPGMVPPDWPQAFPHVTLLITVVNQQEADRDVPKLLAMPAARRGISAEPLLGPINFRRIDVPNYGYLDALQAGWFTYGRPPRRGLDWIIVGGESGANARPMHPDWARTIRDQCTSAGVAFFFKQWGKWLVGERNRPREHLEPDVLFQDGSDFVVVSDGHDILLGAAEDQQAGPEHLWREYWGWQGHLIKPVGKARAGRPLDGREWNEYPQRECGSEREAQRESEAAT